MEQNVIQISGGITINADVRVKNIKYVWNPATRNYESGKYLASIMDDSVITCNEVMKSYDMEVKTIPTNFNEKNITCKTQSFYSLLNLFINHHYLIDSC